MPSYYRDKWSQLLDGPVTVEGLTRLSGQIAYSFLDYYLKDCRYEEEYIDLLCEMTTHFDDPKLNNPGAHSLFSIIVESLCDDFEELQTETYTRVMAQVISYCRRIPAGRELDTKLGEFGLHSSDDLMRRAAALRIGSRPLPESSRTRKILILSRVTIGADIAITSVIIQRLHNVFPHAQIVLIGGSKLEEVYGGNRHIRIRQVPYSRKGGLFERLESWHRVLEVIDDESNPGREEETVLLDPDSRLSQLGVLPLLSEERYFFFDSRSMSSLDQKMSMPELTNRWLDMLLDNRHFAYPCVWIPADHMSKAAQYCRNQRDNGTQKIIAVNFGVGGNPRKTVGRRFEEKLLRTLLDEPDTLILMDKGAGNDEVSYANTLIAAVADAGHDTRHMQRGSEDSSMLKHGIVGIESSIGEMAALVAHSDEYIGYDSAGQHIASALKVPCLTVFAGSNNMRFIRRWSAHGPSTCTIVHVDTLNNPSYIDFDDIISRIMHARGI